MPINCTEMRDVWCFMSHASTFLRYALSFMAIDCPFLPTAYFFLCIAYYLKAEVVNFLRDACFFKHDTMNYMRNNSNLTLLDYKMKEFRERESCTRQVLFDSVAKPIGEMRSLI